MSSSSDFWQATYGGQSFIYNQLSPAGTSYGMNVDGWGTSPGTGIIVWPWQGGIQNELWSFDDDGHLIPGNCGGSMVAGLGDPLDGETGNWVVLVPIDTSGRDATQQWYPTSTGLLRNKSNQAVIGFPPGDISDCPYLVCVPEGSGYGTGFTWTQLPAIDTGNPRQWYFIQTAMPDAQANLGLNITGASNSYLTPVILWPWQGGKPNELWQPQDDGTIISSLMWNYSGVPVNNLSLTYMGPDYGNAVVTGPPAANRYNTWTASVVSGGPLASLVSLATPQNQLVSVDAASPAAGDPVIVSDAIQDGPAPSQTWEMVPTNIFAALLRLPPQPYPPLTGDQPAGYQYINQNLGIPDGSTLRGEYANLNSPLSAWSSQLSDMPPPPPSVMSEPDFIALRDMLQAEISKVQTVINYFSNYEEFHDSLFTIDSDSLNEVIGLAGLSQSDQVSGGWWAVLQGLTYTLLNISLEGWNPAFIAGKAIVANLVSTAMGAAIAGFGGSGTSNDFQVAAGELWEKLGESFSEFNNWVQNMVWTFIADWGKLEAAYPLMLGAGGINSMAWPPNDQMTPLCLPGYDEAVMKMLLPVKWEILEVMTNDPKSDPLNNEYAFLAGPFGWIECSLEALEGGSEPDPALFEYLFGDSGPMNGMISPDDFFRGKNGWNFEVDFAGPGPTAPDGPDHEGASSAVR